MPPPSYTKGAKKIVDRVRGCWHLGRRRASRPTSAVTFLRASYLRRRATRPWKDWKKAARDCRVALLFR